MAKTSPQEEAVVVVVEAEATSEAVVEVEEEEATPRLHRKASERQYIAKDIQSKDIFTRIYRDDGGLSFGRLFVSVLGSADFDSEEPSPGRLTNPSESQSDFSISWLSIRH